MVSNLKDRVMQSQFDFEETGRGKMMMSEFLLDGKFISCRCLNICVGHVLFFCSNSKDGETFFWFQMNYAFIFVV